MNCTLGAERCVWMPVATALSEYRWPNACTITARLRSLGIVFMNLL